MNGFTPVPVVLAPGGEASLLATELGAMIAWDVSYISTFAVQAHVLGEAWPTSLVLTLKWSMDGVNWSNFTTTETISSTAPGTALVVGPAKFVAAVVTVVKSAGADRVIVFGDGK